MLELFLLRDVGSDASDSFFCRIIPIIPINRRRVEINDEGRKEGIGTQRGGGTQTIRIRIMGKDVRPTNRKLASDLPAVGCMSDVQ